MPHGLHYGHGLNHGRHSNNRSADHHQLTHRGRVQVSPTVCSTCQKIEVGQVKIMAIIDGRASYEAGRIFATLQRAGACAVQLATDRGGLTRFVRNVFMRCVF